jgi:hypothetical protein
MSSNLDCRFCLKKNENIVLVVQYGQTEASETMEKLKELPVDVYHELFLQSFLQ